VLFKIDKNRDGIYTMPLSYSKLKSIGKNTVLIYDDTLIKLALGDTSDAIHMSHFKTKTGKQLNLKKPMNTKTCR
jgi:hypothetical protein